MKTKLWLMTALVGMIGLSAGAAEPFGDLTDGLVAYYPFNGNANDESGNGNNGTVNGATLTTDRFGNANSAYDFDGVDDLIKVYSSESTDIADNISVCGWILIENGIDNYAGIVDRGPGLWGHGGYYVRVKDKNLDFAVSQPYTEFISQSELTTASWCFFAATYDNNYIKIYVNGNLDNAEQLGGGFLDKWIESESLIIGKEGEGVGEHHFKGAIDDIRIYNRALSDAEFAALYESEKPEGDLYAVVDLSSGAVTKMASAPADLLTNAAYKSSKIVLRKIPKGSFVMGSPAGELGRQSDEVQHTVSLTDDFYLGVFEITQAQYQTVMGVNPSYFRGDYLPVEQVSWNDARGGAWPDGSPGANTFIGKLCTKADSDFDLPTEAQWEYACRAGTIRAYNDQTKNSGEGSDCTSTSDGEVLNLSPLGWYIFNSGDMTRDVGLKQANAFALYDMHGNAWEWCLDFYGAYAGDAINPIGPSSGDGRVLRSGSAYTTAAHYSRSARRLSRDGSKHFENAGFRITMRADKTFHSISGTVSGDVAAGVSVALSGDGSATVVTGVDGKYSFAGLADGEYTVTPSLSGYSFSPASRSVVLLGGDLTGNNFTASLVTHSISGVVSGDAVAGVSVVLSGDASATVVTDGAGNYLFTGLVDGEYTVTPSLSGYSFEPSSRAVELSGADSGGNGFVSSAGGATTVDVRMAVSPSAGGYTVPNGTLQARIGEAFAVMAVPASGYYLSSWVASGGTVVFGDGASAMTTATVYGVEGLAAASGTVVITANFAAVSGTAELTLEASPSLGGTTDPAVGPHTVATNESVPVSADPADGWFFVKWVIYGSGSVASSLDAETTVVIHADSVLVAVFSDSEPETAALTVSVSPEGSGTASPSAGTHTVPVGEAFAIKAVAADGYSFAGWVAGGGCAVAAADLAETTATVTAGGSAATLSAQFAESAGEEVEPDMVKIRAGHKETVRKEIDEEEIWYYQESKDSYSVMVKLDLSETGFDLNGITAETPVSLTIGGLYDIYDSGFETLQDAADSGKLILKGEKGGSATFQLREVDDNNREKVTEKVRFKWNKSKVLLVKVNGKPLPDSEYNLLDLSGDDDGKLSGQLTGITLRFGDIVWNGDAYAIDYTGSKKTKEVTKDDEDFDLISWKAKGKRKKAK